VVRHSRNSFLVGEEVLVVCQLIVDFQQVPGVALTTAIRAA